MKNQDIFPSEEIQRNFLEVVENSKKFFTEKFFRTQKNFLEPYVVNMYKNFVAGVNAIAQATQEDERFWEEGGIRIQENSPKSGGREETQTK